MPPKPQTFKTPDGKVFESKAEWRDYMMATFYSVKNRNNEAEPIIKNPGDVDGQMFDISDCDGVTIIIMDNVEQTQIDNVKNSRIFIGACASSIFIRNCVNCTFYTACRQLRLREVTQSQFYIYSMAEVHIEYSNTLKFGPYNGGYPEHARHLQNANLPDYQKNNLWYDIFDHNDPAKTHSNWSLIPEAEYEVPWYPAGECAPAIPRTKPGTVVRTDEDGGMQSFTHDQLAQGAAATASPAKNVPAPPAPAPAPAPPAPPVVVKEDIKVLACISKFANFKAGDALDVSLSIDLSPSIDWKKEP